MEPRYAQNILFRRSNIAKAKALLRDAIGQSIIVCYRENVSVLQSHLDAMGLNPHIQRASYSAGERAYPASTRCLLNHRAAWERAAKLTGYSLIVEADYVPCAGLGNLPVFWPQEKELAWGYLYQGSPRILAIVGAQGWIRGHCAPTVAYVINDRVARVFLRFFDSEMSRHAPESYFNFEAHLQWWAMGQGAEAYIPMKHYGEHGGLPNTEHTKFGRLSRGGRHRADNLAGPLAFLPEYAQGRRSKFLVERMMARLYGLARLLTGRWIIDTNVYSRDLRNTVTLYWLGFRRLVT
jgi:hypothetical protein